MNGGGTSTASVTPQQVSRQGSAPQRSNPTLHRRPPPHRPLGVLAMVIPVLQRLYSDIVAFKHKPTSLSGTPWKKSWQSVLSLEKKITG